MTMPILTDTFGRETDYSLAIPEPRPGSIVLVDGEFGTAWQRHFDDGLWHCSRGGRARPYDTVLAERNVVLVYSAADRDTAERPKPVAPRPVRLAPQHGVMGG